MLCEQDSLCARVLKAWYYPDGKLLKARMKSGSSYTWQSLLAGLNVLNRGISRELVMELRLIFGRTTGFLEVIT